MSDHVETLVARAKSGELPAASQLLTEFYERIFAYFGAKKQRRRYEETGTLDGDE